MPADSAIGEFDKGSVWRHMASLALPMTVAQLINVLYGIVDRVYLGHLGAESSLALAGVGVAMPVIAIVSAFANLYGTGGTPLFSISRGRGDDASAGRIMGTTFTMLLATGVVLTAVMEIACVPLLDLFGASPDTLPYAGDYLSVYLLGTVFVMVSLGMNGFINAQGFGRTAMLSVAIGAVLNIALDPLFIFWLDMGVAGAAVATVISQFASAVWVLSVLVRRSTPIRLALENLGVSLRHLRDILSLGVSGFVMYASGGAVQVVANVCLGVYGDVYISVFTVLMSVRDLVYAPLMGMSNGAQPVLSYNYGASRYDRARETIRLMTIASFTFSAAVWAVLMLFPGQVFSLFSGDESLKAIAVPSMRLFFCLLFMESLHFVGQFTFVALKRSREAMFFSLFRKILLVVPLTIALPTVAGMGPDGVFLAEALSHLISGVCCYMTMRRIVLHGMLAGGGASPVRG